VRVLLVGGRGASVLALPEIWFYVSGGFGVLSPGGGDVSDGVGLIYRKGGFISRRVFGG
jgi:hypothetical protein